MITLQHDDNFITKQDRVIRVRRMLADDAPILVDIFDHMSSDSRYKRFNQTLDSVVPDRIWQEALHIAQANPGKSQGLIAFIDPPHEPAKPVGAVRYVETAPAEAEVAISIRDDFQNMGIGTHMMRLLAFEAKDLGYQRLTASIRNDNPAIWKVFNRLPFKVTRSLEGSFSQVDIWLDVPRNPETDET